MKEKTAYNRTLKIKQDLWHDSPCSKCLDTPCCRNLPLASVRLKSRSDFINLLLISCYDGLYPALKESGEWTVYLGRDCRFLDASGKCSIHKESHQSLICKTYDAHNCWYTDAFRKDRYSTMIPFNTEGLIWFEKKYDLISKHFEVAPAWDDICAEAAVSLYKHDTNPSGKSIPLMDRRLSFKKGRSEQFLFFPPYQLPESRNHFELLSFRLGFSGISLAVTDTCWAFMVSSRLDPERLELVRNEFYPAISHKDGIYSFDGIVRQYNPHSRAGEQWVVLQRSDLKTLVDLTVFDASGRIKRRPSSSEILAALQSRTPDRAA